MLMNCDLRTSHLIRLTSLVLVFGAVLNDARAQAPTGTAPDEGVRFNPPSTVLLANGYIVRDAKREIAKGELLIRDGRIAAIGQDLQAPADAQVIDCTDKYIYPALIDAYVEFEATPNTVLSGHWNAQVVPQRRMDRQLVRDAKKMAQLRKAGIGIVLAAPHDRIFKGSSCVITTSDAAFESCLLQPLAFQHLRLLPSRGSQRGGYPNSPMGAVALARQVMLDAVWYQQAWQASQADFALPRPDRNSALEALELGSRSKQWMMLDGPNELFALRANRFAREFSLKIVIRGSGREYRQLDSIAATGRTFIIPVNFPKPPDVGSAEAIAEVSLQTLMHWELAPENPGRLEQARINFVLSTDGLSEPTDLLAQVRSAISRGLDKGAALSALTSRPAELLDIAELAGSLDPGKLANILITNGSLWDSSTKILETWVQGQREQFDLREHTQDLEGRWLLTLSGPDGFPQSLELNLNNLRVKPDGKIAKEGHLENETVKKNTEKSKTAPEQASSSPMVSELKQLGVREERVAGFFSAEQLGLEGLSGPAYLTAAKVLTEGKTQLSGNIAWPNGKSSPFVGKLTGKNEIKANDGTSSQRSDADAEPKMNKSNQPDSAAAVVSKVNFPFGDFGVERAPEQPNWLLIRGATIWTCGPSGTLANADLLVHQGRIEAVGRDLKAPDGAVIINASQMHVSPGIIDCHSHMATDGGVNESGQAVTAEVRVGDFIDSNDINIYRQLAGGVTIANVLHGSANPIGGQNQVIKLRWGALDEDLKMAEAPSGIKFALGENVKQSNWTGTTTRYPQTRMGVEQIMRDRLEAAQLYARQRREWNDHPRGLPPRRDLELDALVEVLEGKRWIHCHSYRQDEILTFLRTMEDFSVRVGSLQHILEGYKVADAMAKHGATGSSFSDWWAYKFEVLDAIPFNGAMMHRAGVIVSFNSDDRELARHLNHEAAKAVKYGGITPEEALKFVTLNPAKQLRIDASVGSLEPGKHADFVLWSSSPLSTLSRCEQTWIDGRKYFDRSYDLSNRQRIEERRRILVQKILESGEKMVGDASDSNDPSLWWVRFDEFCHHHDHDELHDHSNSSAEHAR